MGIDWNWDIFLEQANTTYLGWLWSGFQVTIAVSYCAWIIAFLVGSLFGILRTVPNRLLRAIGTCYIELFRNIPLIVQFFFWSLVAPELVGEKLGMWFKSELDPNIQFFTASAYLPLPASASRYAPPSPRCRAGKRTPAWRWA
nr:Glutamine transport system permease protein GlnP [Candidatus Pantoea persica]